MKKLVSLSIAVLFVVVGMASMANAASVNAGPTAAWASLSGVISVIGIDYNCKGAKVKTSKLTIFKDGGSGTGKSTTTTDVNGYYAFLNCPLTQTQLNVGKVIVTATWKYSIFNRVLNFTGTGNVNYGNVSPGQVAEEELDIEVL